MWIENNPAVASFTMMSISGAFSSLGINERSTNNPQNTDTKDIKVSKNYSTMSLPNLDSTDRHTVSPSFLRNYCDDETESNDQPIDFSKKYCETKILNNETKTMKGGSSRNCTFNKVVKSYNNTFTMYAETDLDQPTDYSLRYAEDDSDSDECNEISKTETAEFVQDTIKTYCTEDTPYETPFNFSTATSMSDLRIDEKIPSDNKSDTEPKQSVIPKEMSNVKIVKSSFSSGLMSPEKPVNYCEEGTPGYFSRVDSCGSLNSFLANDPPKQESKSETLEHEKSGDKEARRVGKCPAEAKAVKFGEVVNYAEETPLMFSRSSSLASLDSIEQHSIHDDRSSVVSDFSRLTSGLISPSELPDSPSQTVPPSPKPHKNPIVFPQIPKKKTVEGLQQSSKSVPKSNVFEDVVKKFKMESTPLQFSTATSLSSLIDDQDEIDSKNPQDNENIKVNQNENLSITEEINNDLSESSEDEDILAACINIGMQNNRYSQAASSDAANYKFSQHSDPPRVSQFLPVSSIEGNPTQLKPDMTSDSLRTYCTEDTPAILSQAGSNTDLNILSLQVENKIRNDSVVLESNDAKIVSKMNNLKLNDLLDSASNNEGEGDDLNISLELEVEDNGRSHDSSFSSLSDASHESEEALLQQCILAGMPKINPVKSVSVKLENSHDSVVDFSKSLAENVSSDDDEDILADCINIGMKKNRYSQSSQSKLSTPYEFPSPKVKPEIVNDSIKSYCTEDTPAVLSHAGSSTDLSVLSLQGNENEGEKDYLSDSNFSDDEDERLLAECVRYGMEKITGTSITNAVLNPDFQARISDKQKADLNISLENISDDDSHSFSSGASCESEQALLQECILAGMPKRKPAVDSTELTSTEKILLQQCILDGMKKCRVGHRKPIENDTITEHTLPNHPGISKNKSSITGRPLTETAESERLLLQQCILAGMPKRKLAVDSTDLTPTEKTLLQQCIVEGMNRCRNASQKSDNSDLTEAEQALLRQCILSGMPKNKNLVPGGPSPELSESERLLLQQCILAGMPKSRGTTSTNRQQWMRRPKEVEKPEHGCCIHCPRNNLNKAVLRQNLKTRRKKGQIRERSDVNLLYVTSQILALKKEIVDRSHEEWV